MTDTIGVAVIGAGWMGQTHSRAYARVLHHYPELAARPRLVAVADTNPAQLADSADRYGFARTTPDWRELLSDPDVQAVSVTAPNFLHRELGCAVAAAGKHLWIEKPVGLNLADVQDVAEAVAAAGVSNTVGFNYRNAPAVAAAREFVTKGDIGTITHVHVRMFSDYAAHPDGALTWRFERESGGNGVLGDLASHAVDLARYLVGEIEALAADTAVLIPQRPRPTSPTSGHSRATGGELGPVENEDYVSCLLRFTSGARGVLEASRVAVAEQNNYGIAVHGTEGAVFWDFRRMGELRVSRGGVFQDQAVTTIFVGPGDGAFAAFQPGSGISMGYDDLKVIEAYNFLSSIADGQPRGATLADAVNSAATLEAMLRSAAERAWVSLR